MATKTLDEIPIESRPKHIAVIMDGNGRWAQDRNLERCEGHRSGIESVRKTLEESVRLNLEQLTLYCLSSENWKRPQEEIDFLMHLLQRYMIEERSSFMDKNVRVEIIGRRDGIPDSVQVEMDKTVSICSKNTGTCLCLAINYGARSELVDAIKKISSNVASGTIDANSIDENLVSSYLYTSAMKDPDLLIRTAGEMRISNFLLWQISYAELWITKKSWPEFNENDLHQAIIDFAHRERSFGGLIKLNDGVFEN
ncbi:MAG: isoprenyl transferase [Planctomycetota bacterium]|nr:isoprenyl transferase [Planctomycetota bacterium]